MIWRSLFETIIRWKGLPGFFYILRKEGERELDSRDTHTHTHTERERERERERE